MKVLIDARKYLTVALALGAFVVVAAPAVAKDRHMTSHASRLGYAYAPADVGSSSRPELNQQSASRSAAIRECNKEAEKYTFHTWQTMQFAVYGECMTNHGQPFG